MLGVGLLLASAALAAPAAPAAAGLDPSSLGYCLPSNPAADPPDVPRGGSVRGPLPGGFSERAVTIGGVRTFVIEGGQRSSKKAVVLVHGNGGSGRDWVGLLPGISPHARVVVYDQPGYGHANKGRGLRYDLAGQTDFLQALLDRLDVDRALVGGHDTGASVALEWAVRHPRRTVGAFIMSGGIAPGYQFHFLAQLWRTPTVGEAVMATLNRRTWNFGLQQGQQKPLPADYVNRTYDDYDRLTRCAVLDGYRAVDSPTALGLRQAAALRPFDLPALVIWGRHDPYIGPEFAQKQRLGFPRAQVEIFEQAAHWPFVDEPGRVRSRLARFTRQVMAEDSRPVLFSGLRLSRTRFRAARRGRAIAPKGRRLGRRVGTRVRYRLSANAEVTFQIQRARKASARRRRCTRYRTLRGKFTHAGKAGLNRLRFTGRLRGRRLRPGRYRLVARARDKQGSKSKLVKRRFRILRR